MPKKHNATGRDKNPHGQYLNISYNFLRSDAWRCLNGSSTKVYLELRMRFNGSNNGQIFLGLDKFAKNLSLGKSTVQSALKELEEKGFIAVVKRGSWIKGQATTWRLTSESWNKQPPTHDWKQWRKPEEPRKPRKAYGSTKHAHDKNFPKKHFPVSIRDLSRSSNETYLPSENEYVPIENPIAQSSQS